MELNKDIQSRDDIKIIIDAFYEKVKLDDTIGFIFNDVADVNWEKFRHHLDAAFDIKIQLYETENNFVEYPG